MTKSEFTEFIKKQPFLDESRQTELIDNVDWMSEQDREFLVKQISETAEVLGKNNQAMLDELQKIETAVKQFKKEELPKMAKAEEMSQKSGEAEEAEELLKKL